MFAMIEAYIDESGIHGSATVCVVAGYFGRRNQWKAFESAWRKVLRRSNVALASFHTKDMIKLPRYRSLMLELATTISNHQIFPVSMIVAVNDFNSFGKEQRAWLTGGSFRRGKVPITGGAPSKPYFIPFQLVLQRVTDHTERGKAHFFCGLDRTFSGYARTLFEKAKTDPPRPYSEWTTKSRLGDIAFPMASETPELQAADLFSHLSYLHMLERGSLRNTSTKKSELLRLCLKNTLSPKDNACMDEQCILETFEKARQVSLQRQS